MADRHTQSEPEPRPATAHKALAINLNPTQYGTIVEIGAGQEVARQFFRAGGASGTIAKTMSAYDMQISDAIYGSADRYVSRGRLESMLDHEFGLLIERLEGVREPTTYFAYAATVVAQAYGRRHECHGWLGLRLQHAPGAPPSDIVLHVRMLDQDAQSQQEALGVLGVNLIHGAFHEADPRRLITSLADNLGGGAATGSDRIEIDLIELRGPAYPRVENRLLNLHLIRSWLTRAVMFDAQGRVVPPGEALHKRDVLAIRGHFRPVTRRKLDMIEVGRREFARHRGLDPQRLTVLAEMTLSTLVDGGEREDADFLARVDMLAALGYDVLVSDYVRYFRLRAFFRRYTAGEVGVVVSIANLRQIFDPQFYAGLEGGILEALGKLFPDNTHLYVYPELDADGGLRTARDYRPPDDLRHLYAHLLHGERIIDLQGVDTHWLPHRADPVLAALERGDAGWAQAVPDAVARLIRERRLFGYSE